MRQSQFIEHVRQYANIARRTGQSFAAPVNAVAQLHQDWIMNNAADVEEQAELQDEMRDILTREYASVDRDFTLDIIPF